MIEYAVSVCVNSVQCRFQLSYSRNVSCMYRFFGLLVLYGFNSRERGENKKRQEDLRNNCSLGFVGDGNMMLVFVVLYMAHGKTRAHSRAERMSSNLKFLCIVSFQIV